LIKDLKQVFRPLGRKKDIMVHAIRVYRTISENGDVNFEEKSADARGGAGAATLQTVARMLKIDVENKFDMEVDVVAIDFCPFHDVECIADLASRRCFALTPEEQKTFWDEFRKE
jgi:hypothetical protein